MKQLEFEELSDFMKYHCDKSGYSEFYKVIDKYKLNGKIWVNNNKQLETNIDIESLSLLFGGLDFSLPQGNFEKCKTFNKHTLNLNNTNSKDSISNDGIFNFVVTNKDFCIYSTLKN